MRPIHAAFAASLIACCATSQATAQEAQGPAAEQRVELSNFAFAPHEIHLRAGQTVVLVLANTASGGHDFAAPEFFAAARIEPADAALVEHGEIDVPGKTTRTVHLVPAAGTYKLTCTHMMHATFGMKGTIVVE